VIPEVLGGRKVGEVVEFSQMSGKDRRRAVLLLAGEFFPEELERGCERFWVQACEGTARLVGILGERQELMGVSVYKLYDWDRISPQLYLQACFGRGGLEMVRLRSFKDLLLDEGFDDNYGLVAEMAYNVVRTEFRGMGLGRRLFEERLRLLLGVEQLGLLFTVAMNSCTSVGVNESVTKYLIGREEEVNGRKDDGLVNVRGLWVRAGDLAGEIGVNVPDLNFETGSVVTRYLSRSFGFVPLGFSRKLSPLWVRRMDGLADSLI